jgi:hypothetical protein
MRSHTACSVSGLMIQVAEHISGTTGIVITVLEKLSRFQIQMSGTPVSFNRRVFLAAVRQVSASCRRL